MFFSQNKNKIAGFTLIELLIVIVIIGILATALFPKLQGVQHKARVQSARKQMQDFDAALMMARVYDFKTLISVTQTVCTEEQCRPETDLRSLPENHLCRVQWRLTLERVAVAAGMNAGALKSLEKDPRGSPYQLDENEGEFSTGDCRRDSFFSAGPDGSRNQSADNIYSSVAPVFCPEAY